jgi:hypothetical protein
MAKTLVDWLPELLEGKALVMPHRRELEETLNARLGEVFMDKVYVVADERGFFLERQYQEDGKDYADFEPFSPTPAELLDTSYALATDYLP